jgi:uncharacterized protein YndB with AHSA1/START domain
MMPERESTVVVKKAVVVPASVERAFAVFTEGLGGWWPEGHHLLKGPLAATVFEPREGGRILDRGVDGRECAWARVVVHEPPHRVVFTWDITPQWELETDPARASEVEVTFTAESATHTRVELEHRHLERHGAGWEQMRDGVAGEQGWSFVLAHYTERVVG